MMSGMWMCKLSMVEEVSWYGVALLWGGFGRLHQVKRKMDHFQYMEILQESLLGTLRGQHLFTCDVIFQQDNNLKHTSHHAQAWIKANLPKILDWPLNSPNMSSIKHCWHYIEAQIYRIKPLPRTLDVLLSALQEEWTKLGDEYCACLHESMPLHVAALKVFRGRHTK